jgi:site-specific DNA-methyltransferase (adenine-specific)/adenine-specific DNA-methyltransferase
MTALLNYSDKIPEQTILEKTPLMSFQHTLLYQSNNRDSQNAWVNLLFFADNLYVLKYLLHLKEQGLLTNLDGSPGVRLIYIDPPYATGDIYSSSHNRYAFSAEMQGAPYIEYLRRRFILMRELLSDNGTIYVRIDYHYGHYIKVVLDEVFGQSNFINEIFVNRGRNMAGAAGKKFEVDTDTILLYAKSKDYLLMPEAVKMPRLLGDIRWTGFLMAEDRNPPARVFLGKKMLPPKGQHWALIQEKVDRLLGEYNLRLHCRSCGTYFYYAKSDGDLQKQMQKHAHKYKFYDITPLSKFHGIENLDRCECGSEDFAVEYLGAPERKLTNNWTDLESYTKSNDYPTENSEELLDRIIRASTLEGDIVLDVFGGAGTTGAVAEKLGRRWIMCDQGKLSIYTIIKRLFSLKADIGNRSKKEIICSPFGLYKLKDVKLLQDEIFTRMNPPEVNFEISRVSAASDPLKYRLNITEFKTKEHMQTKKTTKTKDPFGMLLIDRDYHGNVFHVTQISIPKASAWQNIEFNGDIGAKMGLLFYDIYGNERFELVIPKNQ